MNCLNLIIVATSGLLAVDAADSLDVLRTSSDPAVLTREATALAATDEWAEHLRVFLEDPKFLARLDSDYRNKSLRRLNLFLVLKAVAVCKNGASFLAKLGQSDAFKGHRDRTECLLASCYFVKEPSAALIEYLDAVAVPGSSRTTLAMQACALMGAKESVALLEKRMDAEGADVQERIEYIRYFTEVRDAPAVVALFRRQLTNHAEPQEFRDAVVATLFDYDPLVFGVGNLAPPEPPLRSKASTEVLQELLQIADIAGKLELSSEAKASLAKGRKEIAAILAAREKKPSKP